MRVHSSALKHSVQRPTPSRPPNGHCGSSPSTTAHRHENYGSASTHRCAPAGDRRPDARGRVRVGDPRDAVPQEVPRPAALTALTHLRATRAPTGGAPVAVRRSRCDERAWSGTATGGCSASGSRVPSARRSGGQGYGLQRHPPSSGPSAYAEPGRRERARTRSSASSAVSSASGSVCKYRSVVAMLACPSRSLTT